MRVALKLAWRNLAGAGLRTWLNVGVLSFIYVLIIWHQGLFNGMYAQASRDMIRDEVAGGQFRHRGYDPYDPLTLDESHGPVPPELEALGEQGLAAPVLIRQGSAYPGGRMQSVLIKGIDPGQKILGLPTAELDQEGETLPVLIGKTMAQKNSLRKGSRFTVRWRDAQGTFDALDAEVVRIMETNVSTVDRGQIWISRKRLEEMAALPGEATLIIVSPEVKTPPRPEGWAFRSQARLMKDLTEMVNSKRIASSFMYAILMLLALLAVFDTQILSIFRRRKEIGTLMALGMVRSRVVALFTLEGAMHGLLALAAAAVWGIPVLIWSARKGIPLPGMTGDYGYAIATRLFPAYSLGLVGTTVLVVMTAVIIVSYLPSRRISGWKVTEALKGKLP